MKMVKNMRLFYVISVSVVLMLSVSILSARKGRTAHATAMEVTVDDVTSVNSLTGSDIIYLAKGKKAVLKTTVIVFPNESAHKKVSYKSSNKKVAVVSSKGVIKGKKAGKAKITITSQKNKMRKATVTVIVVSGRITRIRLKKTSGKLIVGNRIKLKASVTASRGGKKKVIWRSSNENVAKVKRGTVTAVDTGNAVISVTAADGTGKKAAYKVTVRAKEKNAADVAALKKIIKEQTALGARIPKDINDLSYYRWDKRTGRLTQISLIDCGLRGTLSCKGITALEELNCIRNQLTHLDVSKNKRLRDLDCAFNELTSLDVGRNRELRDLGCFDNRLTSLDVSKNTKLTSLSCHNNQLRSLDMSKNTNLDSLGCDNNQLTSLDFSKNTRLYYLWCSENQLTRLNVSKNKRLNGLWCDRNQLTKLDLSKNISLYNLDCSMNQLTSVDCSKNKDLYSFECYKNQLTNLDVSENMNLTYFNCGDNPLAHLDVSKNENLYELVCPNNQLASLDVSNNKGLNNLNCERNQLTSLNVGKNMELKLLHCDDNQLTSLDISKNIDLRRLYCSNNQLTSLDLTKNTNLWVLHCRNNQLTYLDVSHCSEYLMNNNDNMKCDPEVKIIFQGENKI